jgi:hypothetical protein
MRMIDVSLRDIVIIRNTYQTTDCLSELGRYGSGTRARIPQLYKSGFAGQVHSNAKRDTMEG